MRETTFRVFFSSRTAFLLFREFSLRFGKSLLVFAEESRIVHELSVRQSRELFQANVKPDGLSGGRERYRFILASKTGEPLSCLFSDGTGFRFSDQRTMNAQGISPIWIPEQNLPATYSPRGELRKSYRIVDANAFQSG